ncbi:hypothetical protein BTO18_08195 [Polaribacter porphyrae]|uniref:SH3b domain-containing protein n=2 Tax=Polaribacter porphyrae TaxID=1137780 RepID=A0A2S7WNI1_9FLAO|nr:hypothetical protein BTO18_08195 [Polaribacter porphyrae]
MCILFFNNINSQSISNDESYLDNDFWEFKIRLANCVIKKDKEALKNLLYDKVLDCWDAFDCAGPEGCNKEQFINTFFKTKKSKHWDILQKSIQIGFRKVVDTTNYKHINIKRDTVVFEAPSFSKDFVTNDASKVIILAENLNLRKNPTLKSTILTKISYGAYNCEIDENGSITTYFGDKIEWIKISLNDGVTGYVSKKFTSAYLDRKIKVAKINGEWKIIMYLCNLNI